MDFSEFGLHPDVLKALTEIGFQTPTTIQEKAIPPILEGRDVLGSAQTGTGKTAAFLLPSITRLLNEPRRGLQILVLEPTRELALQVEEQAKLFVGQSGMRAACVYGGVGMGPQEKAFADGVEIIAATPGRLLDHTRQGKVKYDTLRVLVLDEVDRMLDMGFLPDVRQILSKLPEERQTLFFSATVPGAISDLCARFQKDPVRVAVAPDRKTADGVAQKVYSVPEHLKPGVLSRLLRDEHVTSALVFTRTKQGADKVCSVVEREGFNVERIHGDRSQAMRQRALSDFKEGKVKFLVATDIASRGLDVEGISHVINYDLPDSPDDYVHRVGRTARAGSTGHAYSMVSARDASLLTAIEKHIGHAVEKVMLEQFDYSEEMGPQHEVRQGHDGIRHFDDKENAKIQRDSAALIAYDGDERAQVVILRAGQEMPEGGLAVLRETQKAMSFASRDGVQGRGEGRGGSRERGESRGRGGNRERGGRGGGRGGRDREAPGSDRSFDGGREARPERRPEIVPLSAVDVLRKAGEQKAAIEGDVMELRPRGQGEAVERIAPRAPQEQRIEQRPAQEGIRERGADDRGPRRRRGGRGRGGRDRQDLNERNGHGNAERGGRNFRDRNNSQGRERGQQGSGRGDEAAKPSLWSRLKGALGLSRPKSSESFGDKW